MTLPNVTSTARKLLDRLAAPVAAELPLDIGPNLDGAVDLLRPRIAAEPTNMTTVMRLRRSAHASEGTIGTYEDVDLYVLDPDEVEARFQAMIDQVAGMLRDDAAIAAEGGDPLRAGAKWFTGEAFMLEAARHWGWDPDRMIEPCEIVTADGTPAIIRNDSHVMTNLLTAERDGTTVQCARHTWRRHLSCGHLSVYAGDGKTMLAQYSDHDFPAVRLPGQWLPETVLTALAGSRVRDVVDDARLGPMADLTICGAENGSGGITLRVEGRRTWMDGREKT